MAMFSVNQVRQFYTVNALNANPTAVGDISVKTTPDGEQMYFVHKGAASNSPTRSDLITLSNVMWGHHTKAEAMRRPIFNTVITLNDNVVNSLNDFVGKDFVLKLIFDCYTFPSENSIFVKHGCVHVVRGMNASGFYKALALSLSANISRDEVPAVKVFANSATGYIALTGAKADRDTLDGAGEITGVVVVENPQPWYLGTMEQLPVRWNVEALPVSSNTDNEDVLWCTPEDLSKIAKEQFANLEGYETYTDGKIQNGKKVADMEYFYHGERGDMYREVGFPKNFKTTYTVDPAKEYDLIDIHYAFTDSHEGVQKSERTITLAVDPTKAQTIVDEINAVLVGAGKKALKEVPVPTV